METARKIIIVDESEVETIIERVVANAIAAYFKEGQLNSATAVIHVSSRVDFDGLRKEYYPGIPASTVRQDTAGLSRVKVGKRVLFDRDEVEQHLLTNKQKSVTQIEAQIETDINQKLNSSRREGRQAA